MVTVIDELKNHVGTRCGEGHILVTLRSGDEAGSMKSREYILGVLRREKPQLVERYRLRRLALFGSYARGEQGAHSDVDILVDADPSIGLRFVLLAEELERVLGEHVELVSVWALKPRNRELIDEELVDV